MKRRLDQLIVDLGLAPSRTKAQALIEAGEVILQNAQNGAPQPVEKPSQGVDADLVRISLKDENLLRYVSRGGLKLENALEEINLNVAGFRCLDVGTSTGGFADCLLQKGATHVTGVDVASCELHPKLRKDSRLVMHEEVNAKNLAKYKPLTGRKFDLVVADLSFISIRQVVAELAPFVGVGRYLLILVKPQFEVGRVNLNKRGVVKANVAQNKIQAAITDDVEKLGFRALRYFASVPRGTDGNQEYFLYAQKHS